MSRRAEIGGRALDECLAGATLVGRQEEPRSRSRASSPAKPSEQRGMTPASGPPVAWKVTRQPVAYEAACAAMAERVQGHRRRHRARARLAARAPRALHRRHQRQGRGPHHARTPARAPHRARRPAHLPRPRPARGLRHARREAPLRRRARLCRRARGLDHRHAGGAGRRRRAQARPRRRVGAPARARGGGLRQDRRHRRAALALGELARHQHQRGARSCATTPASCRAASATAGSPALPISASPSTLDAVDHALRAAFERRFAPTVEEAGGDEDKGARGRRAPCWHAYESKSAPPPGCRAAARQVGTTPLSPYCLAFWPALEAAGARPKRRAPRSRPCRPRSRRRRSPRGDTRRLRCR